MCAMLMLMLMLMFICLFFIIIIIELFFVEYSNIDCQDKISKSYIKINGQKKMVEYGFNTNFIILHAFKLK